MMTVATNIDYVASDIQRGAFFEFGVWKGDSFMYWYYPISLLNALNALYPLHGARILGSLFNTSLPWNARKTLV